MVERPRINKEFKDIGNHTGCNSYYVNSGKSFNLEHQFHHLYYDWIPLHAIQGSLGSNILQAEICLSHIYTCSGTQCSPQIMTPPILGRLQVSTSLTDGAAERSLFLAFLIGCECKPGRESWSCIPVMQKGLPSEKR